MPYEPTRECPLCGEVINADAVKCRYCRSRLDATPVATAALSEPWTRQRRGAMLAGVCAGLAERFEISVTVIRLAFVVAALLGFGTALILYVVLWIVPAYLGCLAGDLLIFNGPPMEATTRLERVFVRGREVPAEKE